MRTFDDGGGISRHRGPISGSTESPRTESKEGTIDISHVGIRLHTPRSRPDGRKDWRLLATFSIEFDDCFVVYGCKLLTGKDGAPFVSFPSQKVTDFCPSCRSRTPLRSRFCHECGHALGDDRAVPGPDGKVRIYSDILHPFRQGFRDAVHDAVMEAYHDALAEAEEAVPGILAAGPLAGRVHPEGRVA